MRIRMRFQLPVTLLNLNVITLLLILCACYTVIESRTETNRVRHHHAERRTRITDFRFNTARVDGITRLFNDSLIVISNGYYWVLDKGETPNYFNFKGSVQQLYSVFNSVDAIWTDPYNDISPQIYLASNTPKHGLQVVCQEFFEEFSNSSSFCHLPVNNAWKAALKDLDPKRPIDAVTWRNRTKDKDGGFWVFFQGNKMITIDPYEMHLRYTYDINKWMSINETITAAYYDYRKAEYHFFFENNKYRKWTVNVTYMNRLPMSWDRAFLHGTLSPPMKINRDFFGFPENEIRNWPQPYYERVQPSDDMSYNEPSPKMNEPKATTRLLPIDSSRKVTNRPVTTSWYSPSSGGGRVYSSTSRPSNTYYYPPATTRRTTIASIRSTDRPMMPITTTESDVEYLTPKTKVNIYDVNNSNGKLKEMKTNDLDPDEGLNFIEREESETSFQKHLMELNKEGVMDFAKGSEHRINSAHDLIGSLPLFLLNILLSIVLWGGMI